MSDAESQPDEGGGRLLASLRTEGAVSPAGLGERLSARIRSELVRRDVLGLITGAPVRLVRQLLRRPASRSGSGSDAPPPERER